MKRRRISYVAEAITILSEFPSVVLFRCAAHIQVPSSKAHSKSAKLAFPEVHFTATSSGMVILDPRPGSVRMRSTFNHGIQHRSDALPPIWSLQIHHPSDSSLQCHEFFGHLWDTWCLCSCGCGAQRVFFKAFIVDLTVPFFAAGFCGAMLTQQRSQCCVCNSDPAVSAPLVSEPKV